MHYAIGNVIQELKDFGILQKTQTWQGVENPPQFVELEDVFFRAKMPHKHDVLVDLVKPTMPWALDHFKERIEGVPHNPGHQYKNWPWYRNSEFNDNAFRNVGKRFTHTYMERYWPKIAGKDKPEGGFEGRPHMGIRYQYGDLHDVINLLAKDPSTRQAFLPVWFPEDTGALHGGRVPCTIGYHFSIRRSELNITYVIRACEALRHFRNDIYLTVMLADYALDQLKSRDYSTFGGVNLGILTMHIFNFHVFKQEINLI